MGVFDNFPYTNLHSLNLDWIVKDMLKLNNEYAGLQKEIQETIDYINNFEAHANELIKQQVDIALSYYNQRLIQLSKQLNELSDFVNKQLAVDINTIKKEITTIQLNIKELQFTLNQKLLELEELMHEYKHSIDSIIDGKTKELEQYIEDKVTKLDRLDVINPLTGIFENIQKVLDEMTEIITRSYGITAGQYDSLDITARQYDSYRLTADEYSTRGYFQLYLKLTFMLMRSPFTGSITTIEDVVTRLSELHKCALTAIEYDQREITVEDYDNMLIPAFSYDWFGYKVVSFITAFNYDSLKLSAESYDDKNITALTYSRGMGVLIDTNLQNCDNTCGNYFILAQQITAMQAEISQLKSSQIVVSSGTSYVGICDIGQTISTVPITTITKDNLVKINTDRNVLPNKVDVIPFDGVTIFWNEKDTLNEPLTFTVNVSNKIK